MEYPVNPPDYSIDITNVLLAHECIYAVGEENRVYENGRKVCGLVFALSGKAEYITPHGRFVLDTESIMFLPESVSYIIRCEGDEPFRHFTVNFDMAQCTGGGILPKMLEEGSPVIISTGRRTQYYVMFERISAVWKRKQSGYRVLAKSILYELMYTLVCDIELGMQEEKSFRKVLPAKLFLDESYMEKIDIGELSDMCGLSTTHFRRLFKKLYGTSPLDYQLNMRILKAKDLLFLGEYPVNEVARVVGFEDANYFSRVFKSRVGTPPQSFRQAVN